MARVIRIRNTRGQAVKGGGNRDRLQLGIDGSRDMINHRQILSRG
jgi:hypothetical protein